MDGLDPKCLSKVSLHLASLAPSKLLHSLNSPALPFSPHSLIVNINSLPSFSYYIPLIWACVHVADGNKRVFQKSLSLAMLSSCPCGIPDELYNSSSEFWIYHGASSKLDVPERPPKGEVQAQSLPDAQLVPFDMMSSGSTASSPKMTELLTLTV